MYFYLSFLRPPPVASSVGEQIVLTPQVANDLRTELLEREIRISYQWLPIKAAVTALPQTQLPLTTWYGSGSAYKTLSVAPPRGVKAGDIWSLALFCPPSDVAASSPLDAIPPYKTALVSLSSVEDAGAWAPVPVMSEPIRFTAAIKGGLTAVPPVKGEKVKVKAAPTEKVAKQDRIQRAFVLPPRSLEESSSELLLTEQTSFDLDKKIWDSGLAVAAFMAYHLVSADAPARAARFRPEGEAHLAPLLSLLRDAENRPLRILELGTGSGLVSIALASLLSRSKAERHQIYATDLPSALPLVARNISVNQSVFADVADVHGRALDWEDQSLPPWAWAEPGNEPQVYDLICLVDVTYNVAIFPSLLRTLLALLSPPTDLFQRAMSKETLVLLAWKERDPTGAEKELWRLADEAGLMLELVGSDFAHGGMPVEFWVGRLRR